MHHFSSKISCFQGCFSNLRTKIVYLGQKHILACFQLRKNAQHGIGKQKNKKHIINDIKHTKYIKRGLASSKPPNTTPKTHNNGTISANIPRTDRGLREHPLCLCPPPHPPPPSPPTPAAAAFKAPALTPFHPHSAEHSVHCTIRADHSKQNTHTHTHQQTPRIARHDSTQHVFPFFYPAWQ